MKYDSVGLNKHLEGNEWDRNSSIDILKYAVGALLYVPANHEKIAHHIFEKKFSELKTLVLCLEDSILDSSVEAAEKKLIGTMTEIHEAIEKGLLDEKDVPLIFIRVRSSEQLRRVFKSLKPFKDILTGFNLPKFSASNKMEYLEAVYDINKNNSKHKFYFMPIIESKSVIDIRTRIESLYSIKETIDDMREYALNVRVGGNDFCNQFGVRRSKNNTIYDVGVVNSALIDILNVFGREYVVSAPVWEYFGEETDVSWIDGFKAEIELDKLNGFIGKTIIHPTQIRTVQESMVVDYGDYKDALSILNWKSSTAGVEKSIISHRMNEVKVHGNWARKILSLANIYGVKEKI